MKWVVLAALSMQIVFAFAQYEKTFSPTAFSDTIPSDIYYALKERVEADKANITTKGKEGNYIKSLYDHRFDYVVRGFNEGYFLIEHPLTSVLRKIAVRIHESNPDLPGDLNVYTFASSAPNAVSFGEGTVCINLGLLERLETEDQIAFILCHEFAHYYANHAGQNISRLAALNYDKGLKRELNDIMSSPYGRYSKQKALFNAIGISVTAHSRTSEFEADSLGMVYYLRTGYQPFAPLRVMQILERADRETFQNNIDFEKFFNFTAIPFKPAWTSYSKSNIVYASMRNAETDSLKTHPDCKKRFERLNRQLNGDATPDSTQLMTGQSLKRLNQLASFEIINSHYYFKQYGRALFNAMLLADAYPDEPYPHAMISKCLYQLYKAQKDHNLDQVLELPSPRFEENYDRFLAFLNKLRLHELASLAYEYVTTRPATFYDNEEFIHALWTCSAFEFSKVDQEKVAQEYAQLYPDGKYLREMKNK